MFNTLLLKKIWLKKEEAPILVMRRSALAWFWSWLITALAWGSAFFLMPLLWRYGSWGLGLFTLLVLIGLIAVLRAGWEYYFTCWALTNIRLIDIYQQGFFHRETTEVLYSRIKEAYASKSGVLNGLAGLGDLYISRDDSKAKLKLPQVRGYERAVSEIILQQENYQRNLSDDKERQARYLLLKIKNKLGPAGFDRLIGG